MDRPRQVTAVLLGVFAATTIVASVGGPPALRLAAVGPFLLGGPGTALALWLTRPRPAHRAGGRRADRPDDVALLASLAIGVSLATAALLGALLLYAHCWHPRVATAALAAAALAVPVAEVLRRLGANPRIRASLPW